MLIVKGSIFRNVSEKEAVKFKAQGYAEVKKEDEVKAKPKVKG